MAVKILVASYSRSLKTIAFDPTTEPPSLTLLSKTETKENPSWIGAHPKDRSLVFAAQELDDGTVTIVKLDEEGKGTVVGEVKSGGRCPAHLLALEKELIVGNYMSGTLLSIPITPDKAPYAVDTPEKPIAFSGTGPNKDRQECSHVHEIVLHPTREELLIPDLGADKVWRLLKGESGKWEVKGVVEYAPGSGPRHVLVKDDILYTVLELKNQLASHSLPPLPAEPTHLQSISTLLMPPSPMPTDPPMLGAEILIPPTSDAFPTSYLYFSNRNDPSPEGDSIAIFSVEEKPQLLSEVRSGLKHLRGMVFDPTGKYLIAGGAQGGGLKVFERVDGGKGLKEVAKLEEGIENPTGFLWL